MPKNGTNIFAQIIELVDKKMFFNTVNKHHGDKRSKGFLCWEQFVSMMFMQFGKAQSLNEICIGLRSCNGRLNHLGLEHGPKKSTLAYANEHRPFEIYQDIFFQLLKKAQSTICDKHKFRFKNKLYSMDTTVIDLCLSMFDWAHFRRAKGAVKLHLLLDHDGYLPVFVHITDGKTHEVRAAKEAIIRDFTFPKGSFIACDRGFNDFFLFDQWCRMGVNFVTRMKSNTTYDVLEKKEVPKNSNVLRDEIIFLNSTKATETCDRELRRIEVWDAVNQKVLVLLTNNLKFGSTTIAAIYKDRWQIEIFFKTIKQNLKIKTFVGTTANAVKIQIWTALIAILLLKMLKAMAKHGWSMSNLVALLRFNLFTYRDMMSWLDDPDNSKPFVPDDQLPLFV
jgi:hypothetical protein